MKRILKKLLSMLVVFGGALGLAACAGGEVGSTANPTVPSVPAPSETKPSETKPSETKPSETKPSETKPSETKPSETKPVEPTIEYISIAKAKEIALKQGEDPTKEEYYIRATVKSINKPEFGSMTLTDGTDDIDVFNTKGADRNTYFDKLEDKPGSGDEIVIVCTLHSFNGTPEVKQAYLLEVKHNTPEVDLNEYTEATLLEARDAKAGSKLKVTGVVAAITYTQKSQKNGFMLIDDTASIFVYTKLANEVSVGNTVTLATTKAYYINPKEADASAKLGYMGSNQLTDATMLSNDKKVSDFSMSSIEELTVKQVLAKPINEDHTAKTYKSTAIIKKDAQPGYTNYYINDLDGKTGSYVYTSNSGADFKWLDEFDGKICEVIYTPLNAKCVSGGYTYRLVPISVKVIDNYEFDKTQAADFIYEYYIENQFDALYRHNPELNVLTTVTNDLIHISGTISYESSNLDVIKFDTTATGVVMNTVNSGKSTITAKVTSEGKTLDFSFEIEVKNPIVYETISIAEAISSADKTEVTLRGIVGPSLINKDGFYLMDETGFIAIQATKAEVNALTLGDEVIVRGTKDHKLKDTSVGNLLGQCNVFNSTILDNYYGENALPNLAVDKTFAEVHALIDDVNNEHTTELYRIEAKVAVEESPWSTTYSFVDPTDSTKSIMIYSANGGQLAWLAPFKDKVVTLELALCNWNDKATFKCCPFSVTLDGKTTYNILNLKK